MASLLIILGILALLFGFMVYGAAQSAIHQILGAVIGLSGVVAFGCGAIVDAVNKVAKKDKEPIAKKGKERTRLCQVCAGLISPEDVACPHCGRDLPAPSTDAKQCPPS